MPTVSRYLFSELLILLVLIRFCGSNVARRRVPPGITSYKPLMVNLMAVTYEDVVFPLILKTEKLEFTARHPPSDCLTDHAQDNRVEYSIGNNECFMPLMWTRDELQLWERERFPTPYDVFLRFRPSDAEVIYRKEKCPPLEENPKKEDCTVIKKLSSPCKLMIKSGEDDGVFTMNFTVTRAKNVPKCSIIFRFGDDVELDELALWPSALFPEIIIFTVVGIFSTGITATFLCYLANRNPETESTPGERRVNGRQLLPTDENTADSQEKS